MPKRFHVTSIVKSGSNDNNEFFEPLSTMRKRLISSSIFSIQKSLRVRNLKHLFPTMYCNRTLSPWAAAHRPATCFSRAFTSH